MSSLVAVIIWIGIAIWLTIAAMVLVALIKARAMSLSPVEEDDWVLHDDLGDEN